MRSKTELIEFAKNKFKSFSNFDKSYYSTYWMDDDEEDYEDAYEGLYSILDNVDWIAHGVTKLVIAFKDEPDYVFKIPFRGGKMVDWQEDPCDYVDEDYTYLYSHANKYEEESLSNWDYCQVEEYVYNQSVEWEVEDLFANTFFLMQDWSLAEDHPFRIYASQKIEEPGFYEINKATSDKSRKEASNICKRSNEYRINDRMLAAFVEDYGYGVASQFFDFIAALDVRDLHGDNLGFDSNNNVKVLDYSSFNLEDLC